MGLRPERGLGLIWPSTTKSGPIKPWAIGHRVRCSMQCAHKGVYWNIHESYHRMKVYETPQR